MTFTLGTLAATVVGLVALVGAIAGALVYARGSARKSSADLWRGEAEAQKARADRLEEEVADLRTRVERLEAINGQLAEITSGSAAIADLRTHIDQQHAELLRIILAALRVEGHAP